MNRLRADGNPIKSCEITQVEPGKEVFAVTMSDGWSVWIGNDYGYTPHVGETILLKTWNNPFGQIMGIQIGDTVLFDKTNEEMEKAHQEFVRNSHKRDWEEWRKALEKYKDDPPFDTVDISGMSGGYEATCQRMLYAGMKFLDEHPDFHFDYKQSANIVGVATTNTPWCKMLDKVLADAAEHDCTGAMHQFVVNHLAYIYKHGKKEWLAHAPPERRYCYPRGLPPPDFPEPL